MLESAQRASRLPRFRAPDHLAWFIGPRGYLLQCDGTGMDRLQGKLKQGQHVDELSEGRPDLAAMFAHLLDGNAHRGVMEFGGSLWFVEAAPVYRDGEFLGVSGTSVALQEDEAPKPEPEVDKLRIVEIAGDLPHHDVWSADRFHIREGRRWVTQVRVRPLADLEAIQEEAPERVHVIREPASPSPSRPALRLLR